MCLSMYAYSVCETPQIVCDAYGARDPFVYVDFDVSMKTSEFMKSIINTEHIAGYNGFAFLKLCRDLYNRYHPGIIPYQTAPRIPLIIHQIWIGSTPPAELENYRKTWILKHAHAGWMYVLWTDESVKKLKLYNQKEFDESTNFAHKADILRYELVYQFGGVYVDMDYECLAPLDLFHYAYDFYTAIQPLDSSFAQLGLALFGAVPKHPILKHAILTIKEDNAKKGIPSKTGPVHFTRSFMEMAGLNDRKDIAMPASYFYPLGAFDRIIDRRKWANEGAYAVHWWAKTWMPANYRRQEFRTIQNYDSTDTWKN